MSRSDYYSAFMDAIHQGHSADPQVAALLAQPAVARTPETCLGMIASQADYPRLLASDQAWNCDRRSRAISAEC